jgi:hypothetical protein
MRLSNLNIVILLAFLGSIIRIIYGFLYAPWDISPDQIAWELVLREGTWSYNQLIHYPHEGGTLLVSTLSRFIGWFSSFNSLTISAVILDFISRFIQVYIVFHVLPKKTAFPFGIWTLFATPSILIWGTVNFGLHNLSSVFPFILLYLMSLNLKSAKSQMGMGIFLGLAIWFSYANIVLLPVYIIYSFLTSKTHSNRIFSLITFAIICCLHLITRIGFDSGFHLSHFDIISIRGVIFSSLDVVHLKQIILTFARVLPNAAIGFPIVNFALSLFKFIWMGLGLLGIIGCIQAYKKKAYPTALFISFITIPLFLILYGLSPFYYGNSEFGNFITYRHFTYLFPLLSLMVISGLSSLKFRNISITIFLGVQILSSSLLFFQEHHTTNTSIKAAGWVLGTKYGHEPQKLQHIISNSDHANLLIEGCGWGISTVLFENTDLTDSQLTPKIKQLLRIKEQFTVSQQINFLSGVNYSFHPEVTPQLTPQILDQIHLRLNDPTDNSAK